MSNTLKLGCVLECRKLEEGVMSHLSRWIIVSVCSLVTPCRCFPCAFAVCMSIPVKLYLGFDVMWQSASLLGSINRKTLNDEDFLKG